MPISLEGSGTWGKWSRKRSREGCRCWCRGNRRSVVIRNRRGHTVDMPGIVSIGISDRSAVASGESVVVGEHLDLGATATWIIITLASCTFVCHNGAEIGIGITVSKVGGGGGTCVLSSSVMITTLNQDGKSQCHETHHKVFIDRAIPLTKLCPSSWPKV